MAVLTQEIEVSSVWTEVSGPLRMADGTSYVVTVTDPTHRGFGMIVAADTDSNDAPPAAAGGHPWYPRTAGVDGTRLVFPKVNGRWWWMRTDGPKLLVHATPISDA